VESIVYNNTSRIEMTEDGFYEPDGNPTECALLSFLMLNDYKVYSLMRERTHRLMTVVPFDPIRKQETFAVRHPKDDNLIRIYVKGAPDRIMNKCEYQFNDEGQVIEFYEDDRSKLLLDASEKYTMNQLRIFMYAYKDLSVDDYESLRTVNNDF